MSHDMFWDAVEVSSEERQREMTHASAKVAVAGYWPFLASAEDEADMRQRLALLSDRMDADLAGVTADPRVHKAVREDLVKDYRMLKFKPRGDS